MVLLRALPLRQLLRRAPRRPPRRRGLRGHLRQGHPRRGVPTPDSRQRLGSSRARSRPVATIEISGPPDVVRGPLFVFMAYPSLTALFKPLGPVRAKVLSLLIGVATRRQIHARPGTRARYDMVRGVHELQCPFQ